MKILSSDDLDKWKDSLEKIKKINVLRNSNQEFNHVNLVG